MKVVAVVGRRRKMERRKNEKNREHRNNSIEAMVKKVVNQPQGQGHMCSKGHYIQTRTGKAQE